MKIQIRTFLLWCCCGALCASSAAPDTLTNLSQLELSGYLVLGDEAQVCVADRQTRRSAWLVVGEPAGGVWAERFDPEDESVLLRQGQETRLLNLRDARARELPVARLPDGSVDWFHMNLSEKEKEHVADLMMWDILEIGRQARRGRR